MNQLNRIIEKSAEVGFFYALQTLKWRLISSRLLDINLWIVSARDIQHLAATDEHEPAIRWATRKDIPQLIECGVKSNKLKKYFGKTLKIAVYEHESRIVAYAQYAVRNWDQDDWLTFEFGTQDIFGAGIWVAPEFRGRNIAPQLMKFAWSYFARNGYKRTIGITNALNRNSFRAAGKIGSADFEKFWYLRLFGFIYFHYAPYNLIGRWNSSDRIKVRLKYSVLSNDVIATGNARFQSVTHVKETLTSILSSQ